MRSILVISFIINCTLCFGQNVRRFTYRYDTNYGYIKIFFDSVGETVKYPIKYRTLYFKLLDYRGASDYKVTDKNGKILVKGSYSNGLDSLRYQIIEDDIIPENIHFALRTYYEPLRDGIWTFFLYGKRSELLYNKGIRVLSKKQ